MNNWKRTGLLIALLAFGAAGCKKAHDAGNDSMSVSGSKIEASDGAKASGP
ncbi:hypothetical protein [Caballeronia arationis]|jgi:hypothetical protein|uniref:hypothetical protein n=1 Tax=Caballeronia arationis TaxID=1777142 RepID=UPI00141DF2D6|nr:hypothetical protein [Caballeronia arationis]